jgi:hypothetical protein
MFIENKIKNRLIFVFIIDLEIDRRRNRWIFVFIIEID